MCQGFSFAGIASGLKKNGLKDLGLIACERPATVAGVFTRNQVKAAPVLLDMKRITSADGSGVARANRQTLFANRESKHWLSRERPRLNQWHQ